MNPAPTQGLPAAGPGHVRLGSAVGGISTGAVALSAHPSRAMRVSSRRRFASRWRARSAEQRLQRSAVAPRSASMKPVPTQGLAAAGPGQGLLFFIPYSFRFHSAPARVGTQEQNSPIPQSPAPPDPGRHPRGPGPSSGSPLTLEEGGGRRRGQAHFGGHRGICARRSSWGGSGRIPSFPPTPGGAFPDAWGGAFGFSVEPANPPAPTPSPGLPAAGLGASVKPTYN